MPSHFEFWKNALREQYFSLTGEALKERFAEWLNVLSEEEKKNLSYYDNKLVIRMFLGDERYPGISSESFESQFPLLTSELLPIIREWKASRKDPNQIS